jgi:hypothetical protein
MPIIGSSAGQPIAGSSGSLLVASVVSPGAMLVQRYHCAGLLQLLPQQGVVVVQRGNGCRGGREPLAEQGCIPGFLAQLRAELGDLLVAARRPR